MLLLTTCLFVSALLSFSVMLEFVQQHLRRDTPPWRRRTSGLFLWTLSFDYIGHYLCFGVNSSRFFGRRRLQDLGLRKTLVFGHVHHIGGKWMLINLPRPVRSFKFQLSLLEGQLNLLSEDFALICIMRHGVVPFAALHVLEFFFRRDFVVWL